MPSRTPYPLASLAACDADACLQAVASAPLLGGNGAFQAVTLPATGVAVVLLPRWNIIALAQRPVALSVADVAEVPEIAAAQPVQRVRTLTPSHALLGTAKKLPFRSCSQSCSLEQYPFS